MLFRSAIQDQTVRLDELMDPDLGNDRASAYQAAIEGHATLVMFEYMTEAQVGSPVDLSEVPGIAAALRGTLEAARSQFPALASAPPVLQESLIFPYVEGVIFLSRLWARGERVVPFGENLPTSTAAILDGAAGLRPVELELTVEGGVSLHEDVLGRLELEVLLEQHLGATDRALARGWAGDRYVLVEAADGSRSLVSYVVWRDAASRDAFAAAMGRALDRFGGDASIDRVDVGEWPATRLTVDRAAGVRVRVSGAERR